MPEVVETVPEVVEAIATPEAGREPVEPPAPEPEGLLDLVPATTEVVAGTVTGIAADTVQVAVDALDPTVDPVLTTVAPVVGAVLERSVAAADATEPIGSVATPLLPQDPVTVDPVTVDPVGTGPVGTGPVTTGPVTTGPVTTGPVGTGPARAGPVLAVAATGPVATGSVVSVRSEPPARPGVAWSPLPGSGFGYVQAGQPPPGPVATNAGADADPPSLPVRLPGAAPGSGACQLGGHLGDSGQPPPWTTPYPAEPPADPGRPRFPGDVTGSELVLSIAPSPG